MICNIKMETKICSRCGKEKETNKFRKKRNQCKECEKELITIWRGQNKEHRKEYAKRYFQDHKEEILVKRKEYMYNYRQTTKYKKHKKEYAHKNKDKVNEQMKKRYTNDMIFKLKHNVRVEVLRSFKLKYKQKNKHTEELTGCSLDFLINYLLQTYKTKYGCDWDGIEKIHIDHKKPLVTASTEKEVIQLCHYTNLQLLKAVDNLKKGILYE